MRQYLESSQGCLFWIWHFFSLLQLNGEHLYFLFGALYCQKKNLRKEKSPQEWGQAKLKKRKGKYRLGNFTRVQPDLLAGLPNKTECHHNPLEVTDTWPPHDRYGTPKGKEKTSRVPDSLSLLSFSSYFANVSVNVEAIFALHFIYLFCVHWEEDACHSSSCGQWTTFRDLFLLLSSASHVISLGGSTLSQLTWPRTSVVWLFYACIVYSNSSSPPSLTSFSSIPMLPPHSFIPVHTSLWL